MSSNPVSQSRPQNPPPRRPSTPSGLNGAPPTAYDSKWRTYTDLTSAQRAAFIAMPETLQQVARDLRHGAVLGFMPKVTVDMTLAQITTAFDSAKAAIAAPFATETTVFAAIGKTIKTQDDVVAAFNPKAT